MIRRSLIAALIGGLSGLGAGSALAQKPGGVLKIYHRDQKTKLAPPVLKEAHPLGKSPVIKITPPGSTETEPNPPWVSIPAHSGGSAA